MKTILVALSAAVALTSATAAFADSAESPAAASLARLNSGSPHLNVTVSPGRPGNEPSTIHFDAINRLGGTATVAPGTRNTFTAPREVLDMNFGKGQPRGQVPPGVTVTRTSATTITVTAARPPIASPAPRPTIVTRGATPTIKR
jgi:hypothetical protein